jgi:alpha-galactosidase
LEPHGITVLKLSGITLAQIPSFEFYNAASSQNTLIGGASIRNVTSSISVVGFIGNGGQLVFENVDGGSAGGTKLVSIDYINADFVFSNTACSNCRNAFISVNGGTPVEVQMPISGQVCDFYFVVLLFAKGLFSLPVELGYHLFWIPCLPFWIQCWENEYYRGFQSFRFCS